MGPRERFEAVRVGGSNDQFSLVGDADQFAAAENQIAILSGKSRFVPFDRARERVHAAQQAIVKTVEMALPEHRGAKVIEHHGAAPDFVLGSPTLPGAA